MVETKKELTEEDILKFWKAKKIYEKSKLKNKSGKGFYMMDGPPYANGNIHMGTALNKISKDIAMRMKRMQGFDVFDRPGYDTHGMPIEIKVEKENNFKSKQDIEKFGVKKFIERCKDFATKYIDVMNDEFINLGTWFDFENPYLTLTNSYVETVWDTFKDAEKNGLVYLGKYPVHACPKCETAVAFNEIEYAKQEDTSVYVKFPLKDKKNTYFIIWTTTPWTLPANTGIMVHPDFDYVEIELSSGEKWILSKELMPKIMSVLEMGYVIKGELKGKEMKGWGYENPLSKYLKLSLKNAYRVVLAPRYVTTEEGTGLVHCAPGHGKEDYDVGKENNLDAPCPVGINGDLTEEAGKYAGKKARIVDSEIIEDLQNDGMLVYKQKYSHDYPLCWRCNSSLLMVSQPQWFLKVSETKETLLKRNEEVNWLPKWAKLRMKAWLEGISDWPVSRNRYWGTPVPVWICEKCEKRKVVGSLKELEKLYGKKIKEIHKPEIDDVFLKCECGGKMKRISEVLDVWFDSGVSSWAALDYMQNKNNFEKFWPANLNLEGKDQIRGWWNSQMILSEIKFGKKPFDSISMHGMILDLGKQKMSKSKGNVVQPVDIINKYSRDYLRYYFAKVSKGDDFSYNEKDFEEIKKFMIVFSNVNRFIDGLENESVKKKNVEDKWILSRYNSFLKEVIDKYNSYEFFNVVKLIENFVVEDLSKTYIRLIRERSNECYDILNEIRIGILKFLSPICPFMSEKIWQELLENKKIKEESVHLSIFPEIEKKKIDEGLESQFILFLKVVEDGLRKRDEAKIGLKWPLAKVFVYVKSGFELEQFKEVIKSQLNVKDVIFGKAKESELEIELDTKMNEELEAEGFAREIARKIQAARKNKNLNKQDVIELVIDSEFNEKLEKQLEFLKERTGAKLLFLGNKNEKFLLEESGDIKTRKYIFKFNKL